MEGVEWRMVLMQIKKYIEKVNLVMSGEINNER